jgi:hypothetical protein
MLKLSGSREFHHVCEVLTEDCEILKFLACSEMEWKPVKVGGIERPKVKHHYP